MNDEYDPLPKLMRDKADLERAMKDGLINKGAFDFGWNKEVSGVVDRLGVGGPSKLTDAVHVGSQEDARLLANFMAGGNQQKTTEDLLKMIERHLAQIKETNARMERAPVAKPVDFGAGGDF